jgi:hypothetical protein
VAVAAWISALCGIVAVYLAWRTMRIQEGRGADPTVAPEPDGEATLATEAVGTSGVPHAAPGGASDHIGLPNRPPPGAWTVLPARRWMARMAMILGFAMAGASVLAFFGYVLMPTPPGIPPAVRLAGGLGCAAGVGFFGGNGGLGYRLLTNPWELAIGTDGLLLRAAGRSWMVRWDEVRQVTVQSVSGSSAIVLRMAVATEFPALWRAFQPGPKWWNRRRAVVFTFIRFHRGGLQAIAGALRYYAGGRWSET